MTRLVEYLEAKKIFSDAETKYDHMCAMMDDEITHIFKVYCTAKNKVSDRSWRGEIDRFRISDKWVSLTAIKQLRYGAVDEFRWKFPIAWLTMDAVQLQSAIDDMIADEGQKIAQKKRDQLQAVRKKELAQLAELQEKYHES